MEGMKGGRSEEGGKAKQDRAASREAGRPQPRQRPCGADWVRGRSGHTPTHTGHMHARSPLHGSQGHPCTGQAGCQGEGDVSEEVH